MYKTINTINLNNNNQVLKSLPIKINHIYSVIFMRIYQITNNKYSKVLSINKIVIYSNNQIKQNYTKK